MNLNTFDKKILNIEKKLKDYLTSTYDLNIPKVSLKIAHTFRVRNVNDQIVASLNLSDRDAYLSTIIALFHDYARFVQVTQHGTLNDLRSFDHGDLAAKLLIEDNQIENFVDDLTKEEKQIINIAIRNHNKYAIEDGLDDRTLLLCKIIRDSDKVDILNMCSTMLISHNNNETNVTLKDTLVKNFYDNKLVQNAKDEDYYTIVFKHLSLIFDLNFLESFKIIDKNEYIKNFKYVILLWADFKIDQRLLECFDYASEYVKKKANLNAD